MINLFEEFYYNEKEGLCLTSWDTKRSFYLKDAFDELLQEKLEKGRQEHEFINLKGIRGIGKTKALVDFAKKSNYVIVTGLEAQAESIRKQFDYKEVVSQYQLRGKEAKKLVLDETADFAQIKEFKNQIITGYVRNNDEHISKSIFKDDVNNKDIISVLNNEIKQLLSKIAQARRSNNFDTYKNLIQVFANILELKNRYESEGKTKGVIVNKVPIEISIQDMEEFSNTLNDTISNYLVFTVPKN